MGILYNSKIEQHYKSAVSSGYSSNINEYLNMLAYMKTLLCFLDNIILENSLEINNKENSSNWLQNAWKYLIFHKETSQNELSNLKVNISPVYDSLKQEISNIRNVLLKKRENKISPLTFKLPEEFNSIIKKYLQIIDENFVIRKFNYGLELKIHDLYTLQGTNWLNDEIINIYFDLIKTTYQNVYTFNSFFWPKLSKGGHATVARWTRLTNIFEYNLILLPIHLTMHWCLVCIEPKNHIIKYYDSLKIPNRQCLQTLLNYIETEWNAKRKDSEKVFDKINWSLETITVSSFVSKINV